MILTRRHISEEDKALAGAILDRDTCRHGPNADCSEHHYNNLVSDIANALAIARKEARAEAFKEAFATLCSYCADGDQPMLDAEARWYYHGEGREQVGCSASKLRILEAAATTRKGENDESD